MTVQPLHDRILIQRIEEEERTKSGIIIPDTAKEKPQEGRVIAAGPGKLDEEGHRHPLDVNPGDRILFSKYAGTEIDVDGAPHLIVRENDVLAVLQ